MTTLALVEVEDPWEREYLESRLSRQGNRLLFLEETAEEVKTKLREAEVLSVFIKSRIDRSFLEGLPKLRFIATRSTGFEHIDLAAAGERNIAVSNVPTYGENTVAEHAFALILSLSRSLRKAYLRTIQNNFSIEGLMGFDLKGKTLGVIGTGHIGVHVIRIGVAFGMRVIAYDARPQKILSEALNFDYVPLEELFKQSDILTLHVPFLPSTRHLINQKAIQSIKKGAILINTARGGLVDTDALVKALDEGILSGAGLDVLEEEEFILEEKRLLRSTANEEHWSKLQTTLKNHVLLHRENVVYTPHMAFYSREAVQRILDTTLENIQAFLSGKPINQAK